MKLKETIISAVPKKKKEIWRKNSMWPMVAYHFNAELNLTRLALSLCIM